MKARRLEDVFEECLTAYLEKGRSVEESLSLYPALAPQLEPLLRTAVSINATLEAAGPPWHAMERGRYRFLASARAYATGKALLREAKPRHSAPWGRLQWSVLGGAVAAAAAVVVVGAVLVGGSSGTDGGGSGVVQPPSPTARAVPQTVLDWQLKFSEVAGSAAAGRTPSVQEVEALKAIYEAEIAAQLADPSIDAASIISVQQIQEQKAALEQLPPAARQDQGVIGLLSLMDQLLQQLSATPTPAPATPAPTAPGDTPAPTGGPAETPAPTPAPTGAPADTPAPATDTPGPTGEPAPQQTPAPTPVFRLFGS